MLTRIDRAADGCATDAGLYALCTAFALVTVATATLPPHYAWARTAWAGYAVATVLALLQLAVPRLRRLAVRVALAGATVATTTVLPLLLEAVQRSAGRTDRAQEEVLVVEDGGARLLHSGTPYLGRGALAALPVDERLLGYLPYQPGMALFGLPRALHAAWWSDARVFFALVTFAALGWAARLLWTAGVGAPLLRAGQAVLVVPLGSLALAVGGDDLPVLALCLLALAFAARDRYGAAGLVVGVAGALKLFAWPVALVLIAAAACAQRLPADESELRSTADPAQRRAGAARGWWAEGGPAAGWRHAARCAAGALGVPVLALVPAVLVDPGAAVENVVRFPLGRGLVGSPAASNFPGHLIALWLPGGGAVATGLLLTAGAAIGVWLWRRPPRDAADAALVCAAGLLAATLLMPSTRFGYLLYPLAFAVAAPALRPARTGRPVAVDPVPVATVDGAQLTLEG